MTNQEILAAIENRHSVRQYINKTLSDEVIALLQQRIAEINAESGLHIQLVTNEPQAYSNGWAKYGKFTGCSNYFVIAGKSKQADLAICAGYYGEQLVLYAQHLGLNTCWTALTHGSIPNTFTLCDDEKVVIYIALGYGATQGVQHPQKKKDTDLSNILPGEENWFAKGVRAAMLAPTAVNQQKFYIEAERNANGVPTGKVHLTARFSLIGNQKLDLGIVRYHFEVAAGKENFTWAI